MIRIFRHYISRRKALFVLGEGILIFLAVYLTAFLIHDPRQDLMEIFKHIWVKVLLVSFVAQVSLYFNDLYEFKTDDQVIDLGSRLIQSVGITSIVLAAIYFIWPRLIIGRWIFFLSLIFLLFFLVSWRFLYSVVIRKKLLTEKAIIVGFGGLAKDILHEIHTSRDLSYDIECLISNKPDGQNSDGPSHIPILTGFDRICETARANDVQSIIVALDEKRGIFPVRELLDCKMRGISIIDGESFYERITGKLIVEKINPSWLIFSDGFIKSGTSRFVKRTMGFALSFAMLLFLLPLMALVAFLIRLESKGPAIFSQERVGEFGEPFTLYKFRSMRPDAEKESGPVWAEEDDPRITKVGKIIRKLRIDELPQLWNVLRGDMSFVGPRPERRFFVEQLKRSVPYYNERFAVKPGITGWAQVLYPYGASEEDALEKLKYDLYYIKNMTMMMDLAIIFQTVKIVLLGRGSR